MAEKPPNLQAGTRLGDGERYEVRQRIGVGGMAEVYQAVDTRLGSRTVAIKILSASIAEHPFADKMRALFIQEAQALSRVKDENVVDVLDFGTAADGTPYMVMDFLHGMDLGAFLRQTKHVALDVAVDVMLGVCGGVHACHLAGIIHRDLKPANIFLSRTPKGEHAKVLDFSVAKIPLARTDGDAEKPQTDLIVGTPSYMSPEQALGRPANELSDQYSIGALLYRCLTGRPPQGLLPRPRDARPDIPEHLEEITLRVLDPVPANRFASVHEFGQALVPFASPAARERWKPYYLTPPRPIDPLGTGPIPTEAAAKAPATVGNGQSPTNSSAATVAVSHDSGVHERTTSPRLDAQSAISEPPKAPEILSSESSPEQPVAAPTFKGAPSVAADHSGSVSIARQRGRRLFIAIGAGALLVVGATATSIRLASSHRTSATIARPEWIRPATKASAPTIVPATLLGAPPTIPSSPAKVTKTTEAEDRLQDGARSRAPSRRPRRHRPNVPGTGSDGIQYGPDGLPILH